MSGFFWGNPWGLLALASLVAVLAMYLFYQRYRPMRVTGLFLWGVPLRSLRGGRRLEPPRRSRSLLLDLLAALLIALALASPALLVRAGRLPVLILDDSFSMQARGNDREALLLARTLLAQGQAGAVILAGAQPRLLVQPDAAPQAAHELLAGYRPFAAAADFTAALKLASSLYSQRQDIHIITDHPVTATPRGNDLLTVHQLAGRGGNVALTGLWREVQTLGGREEESVFARITNYSDQPATVEYQILLAPDALESAPPASAVPSTGAPATSGAATSKVLFRKVLQVGPGETADCEARTDGSPQILQVRLLTQAGEDVIAEDSTAYLPPASAKRVTYALDGGDVDAARFVRMGLDAAGATELSVTLAGAAKASRPAGTQPPAQGQPTAVEELLPALLVTGDPAKSGRALTLELLPAVYPATYSPPFIIDLADPVCRDVHLGQGYWTAATDRPGTARESWLIAADRHPLFWRAGDARYCLNLVPQKSSIVTTNAWPALLLNLVEQARQRLTGLRRTAYAPGQTVEYRSPVGAKGDLQMFAGSRLVASARSDAFLRAPLAAGLYELRQDAALAGAFAVLPLYDAESDTRTLAGREQTTQIARDEDGWQEATAWLFWLPLALGVLLLALNWLLGEEGSSGSKAAREEIR